MNDSDLWQTVLGEIELSTSRASFLTWFKNTALISRDDKLLVIGVPNVFIKQQLETKFNVLIVETLKKNGVGPEKIEYKIYAAPVKEFVNEPNNSEPLFSAPGE